MDYNLSFSFFCTIEMWLTWASRVGQVVKNLPAVQKTQFDPWFGKIPWRRKWPPTPVFLPGELHGQRNLGGYCPWGCKELDKTEQLTHTQWLIYWVSFWCRAKWFSYMLHSFHVLFHSGLWQDVEYSSLCSIVGACCLSILYINIIVRIC